MRRLWPSSLLGQVMWAVALALLVAQVVSVTLLYRAGEERRETAAVTAAAFRLVTGAEQAERQGELREARAARRAARNADGPGEVRGPRRLRPAPGGNAANGRMPRPLRYHVSETAPIDPLPSEGVLEERLREILSVEGIDPHRIATTIRRADEDPLLLRFAERRTRLAANNQWRDRMVFVATIQREEGGAWETARVIAPRGAPGALGALVLQTLITFGFLIVILYFVLRRITRPLAQLTERVSHFSHGDEAREPLAESGPADTRGLIAAYNTMEARVAAMLDEKDVMLGAIGHDLKTPLAALRVRIESVTDEAQRNKMAAAIEDITATLDDILSLARLGRSDAFEVEAVDLGALAISVAQEFEDLGDPVTITDPPRLVARVQVTWVKRALRNLVANAVRYGTSAEVSLSKQGASAVLRVDDAGPGIAEDRIEALLEPFARGEESRNRATGGAGLGLTLARAIVQQHGGELTLANREEGGLRAEIRLPTGG